jgi:hypothetical protein
MWPRVGLADEAGSEAMSGTVREVTGVAKLDLVINGYCVIRIVLD